MKYEVVELKEKTVVGVSVKTGNNDPEMGKKINDLWEQLYTQGISEQIKNKANEFAVGLYSDYEGEGYVASAGLEVTKNENPELTQKVIPAGRYAKFSIHGDMVKAVADAWGEIWKMDLDRSFTGDFEEYLSSDMENADINIYIALK